MADLSSLDSGAGFVPADQQLTAAAAALAANTKTKDSFTVQRSGLDVVANKAYAFSFSYVFEDPDNPSQYIQGTRSPNFIINLQTPDLTKPVTNLSVTPGLLLYGVKWDPIDKSLSDNKWFIDAQVYESLTGTFTGEEYLVWNGTGNSATVLVSNTANRWIRVDTRDQDYRKKSVTYGPFKATDPITVDTVGPGNVLSVDTSSKGIDTSGYLGFNAYVNVSWPAVTGGGIRGYRIRFTNDNGSTYSYVDSPGTGTTYKLAGLAIGSTYKIAVATYDEYNNTSSSYIDGADVLVSGTPSVSNYITGGPFQFGVGVGGTSTNKGLYFDASNYWYVNASNSARLKVGGLTNNYLLWDGSTFAVDGNITARGGQFSGNIFMSTSGASIYNGTIDAATGNLTGNGFALNSTGLKVANGTNSVTISAAAGSITANAGSIAGWNLNGTTLSKNNVILDSGGQIQLGSTANASVYLKSSGDFVMWAGNNTPDANAKFRVGSDGTLYATNATVTGNITANSIAFGATYDGTSLSTIKDQAATAGTALQPGGNLTGSVNGVPVGTVTGNAAKGASAVQPGNGIEVDATTKAINAIKASSGLPISSGGTRPVYMDHTGLYMKNALGQNTIFLDSSSGSAVFRGDIYADNGYFKGDITGASGKFTGNIELIGSSWLNSAGVLISDTDLFGSASRSAMYAGSLTISNGGKASYIMAGAGAGGEAQGSLMLLSDFDVHIFGVNQGSGTIYANRTVALGIGSTSTLSFNAGGLTRVFADGRIFANSLNTTAAASGNTSGTSIVQNSSGYLKVLGSSRKLKENIVEIPKDGYLDAVLNIRPVNFNYINPDPEAFEPTQSGLIAEDLDLIPEFKGVVNYDLEGAPISIGYDRLSALLVLAIQELKSEVNTLKERLDGIQA